MLHKDSSGRLVGDGMGRGHFTGRSICEGRLSIDPAWMRRHGLVANGNLVAGTRAEVCPPGKDTPGTLIGYTLTPRGLELSYRPIPGGGIGYQGAERREFVGVVWSACHMGGRRPWFTCPGCSRRVGKLYLQKAGFRCRTCGNFVYASQHALRGDKGRLLASKIRTRLGGSGEISLLPQPFPEKPRGMRTKRYKRFIERASPAEMRWRATHARGL